MKICKCVCEIKYVWRKKRTATKLRNNYLRMKKTLRHLYLQSVVSILLDMVLGIFRRINERINWKIPRDFLADPSILLLSVILRYNRILPKHVREQEQRLQMTSNCLSFFKQIQMSSKEENSQVLLTQKTIHYSFLFIWNESTTERTVFLSMLSTHRQVLFGESFIARWKSLLFLVRSFRWCQIKEDRVLCYFNRFLDRKTGKEWKS